MVELGMEKDQKDRWLGIKKETIKKAAGYGIVGVALLGLLALL